MTCSHHLNLRFWSGSFLFNSSSEPGFTSYPRVPRGFSARLRAYSILSGYGLIFLMYTACAALLPGYWWLHLSHGPSGSHMGRYRSALIISVLSLPPRIYSIFYWTEKNGPPLPDIFPAGAVCIPASPGISHSCYPAHFSRNACISGKVCWITAMGNSGRCWNTNCAGGENVW